MTSKIFVGALIVCNTVLVSCLLIAYRNYLNMCMKVRLTNDEDVSTCLLTHRLGWNLFGDTIVREQISLLTWCFTQICGRIQTYGWYLRKYGMQKCIMFQHGIQTLMSFLHTTITVYNQMIDAVRMYKNYIVEDIHYVKNVVDVYTKSCNSTITTNAKLVMNSMSNLGEQIVRLYINNIGQVYVVVVGLFTLVLWIIM